VKRQTNYYYNTHKVSMRESMRITQDMMLHGLLRNMHIWTATIADDSHKISPNLDQKKLWPDGCT
jgi:hypothetical protein